MRILFITEFFPDSGRRFSGGVETRTYFVARHLSGNNEVTVICRRKQEERQVHDNKLKIIRLGSPVKDSEAKFSSIFPRVIFIFQSFLEGIKIKADVVEGSNFICLIPAFFIGVFKKIPSVAWYPDIYGNEWFVNFGIVTGLFGWILEKIGLILPWTHIIALSKQTENKLVSTGIPSGKISVIYGGVDLESIKNVAAKKFSDPAICCISRLVPYKNVDLLIKLVASVKKEIPHVKCYIIGKGPEENNLKQLCSKLGLKNNIRFLKNLEYSEVIKYLKSSTLLFFPSRIEGFGLVTLESMACSVPYLSARTAINTEVFNGCGGMFFNLSDQKDMEFKLLSVLLSRNKRQDLLKGTEQFVRKHDWKNISGETEDVFKKAVNKEMGK